MDAGNGSADDKGASSTVETIDVENHTFVVPKKEIFNPEDIEKKWQISEGYKDIIGFMEAMNTGVHKTKITDEYFISETTEKLVAALNTLDGWIEELPPVEQPQRFGNKAFRDWFKKLQENCESLLSTALDEKFHPAIKEISVYLVESVGNSTRIDYGTGHEMSFVAFLCCLFKIGVFTEKDTAAVILKLFSRYLQLMRKLQLVYRMEPAGSHGVWSLDDYCFLPFYWGSSQLIDHPRISPKSIPNPEICQSFAKDYMFLNAVNFIHKVKTGPFAEHSNQLWNISGVRLWSKVNSGLFKMYKAEVLSKFPVIQHFLFGSLITIEPSTQVLGAAVVEDATKQDMRHFWCYFCHCECERDKRLRNMLLKEAAIIEHLSSAMLQCSQTNNHQRPLMSRTGTSNESSRVKGVRTVEAHGDGLTCVRIQNTDSSSGNIFSDAPPPWAQSDTTCPATGVIGPTLDDLHKHVENSRKRKLPAERVGANFKHSQQQSSSWLPSFGRVWSKKRNTRGSYRGQFVKHNRTGT